MSTTMALASSSLNPNAPLFIPAAYRRVEDFSPEWWELVQTTAWFRDHWFRQHELHEARHHAALAALPDDLLDDADDLFYYAPSEQQQQQQQYQEPDPDAAVLLGALNDLTTSPPTQQQQQFFRHAEKPAQHVGVKAPGRRVIHQPR